MFVSNYVTSKFITFPKKYIYLTVYVLLNLFFWKPCVILIFVLLHNKSNTNDYLVYFTTNLIIIISKIGKVYELNIL